MQQLTREREPQGAVTRVEDAANNRQLFDVAVALEDTNWLQNDDKRRTRDFVDQATRRIALSRLPTCSWWQFRCQARRREAQRALDAVPVSP